MASAEVILASIDHHYMISDRLTASQLREHQARGSCITCDLRPGDTIRGASGAEYVLGRVVGMAPSPGDACDAPGASVAPDGRCRCVVCPRCGHHTGNSHQGHHWGFCKVTGTVREPHLCCPDDCELEAAESTGNSHNRKD